MKYLLFLGTKNVGCGVTHSILLFSFIIRVKPFHNRTCVYHQTYRHKSQVYTDTELFNGMYVGEREKETLEVVEVSRRNI